VVRPMSFGIDFKDINPPNTLSHVALRRSRDFLSEHLMSVVREERKREVALRKVLRQASMD